MTNAIDSNGTIYVGSNSEFFLAIYPNGTKKWEYQAKTIFDSSPAIDSNGIICIGTGDGFDSYVYTIYPNGTKKWSLSVPNTASSVAIGPSGTLYVGTSYVYPAGHLYAIDMNGNVNWTFDSPGGV